MGHISAMLLGLNWSGRISVLADLLKLGILSGLGIMARRSFVDRSPDTVERYLRAMVRHKFINTPRTNQW
jgi:hypothetical protein